MRRDRFAALHRWPAVAALRAAVPPDVVVIANGGVADAETAAAALAVTGADAVMSGEGLLANPALFCGNRDPEAGAFVDARRLAREYLELAEATNAHPGDARGHIFKMLHGGLSSLPGARDALAAASSLEAVRRVVASLDAADPDGDLEARHHAPDFDPTKSWYWRHRVEGKGGASAPPDASVVLARRARRLRKAQHRAAKGRRRRSALGVS